MLSCKRYKDPAPFTDPRIVNEYCNIPSAINYNWNFPGIPNDSTCIFPAEIYAGNYFFRDSIFNNAGTFLDQDSFPIVFAQLNDSNMTISGFCPGNLLHATASRFLKFTIDTVIGNGQALCNADTIEGGGLKYGLSDSAIKLVYQVNTDTGIYYHAGTAIKQ